MENKGSYAINKRTQKTIEIDMKIGEWWIILSWYPWRWLTELGENWMILQARFV